jgi:hypothetical protein
MRLPGIAALAVATGVACAAPLDPAREARVRERGAAAVAPLKQRLLAELSSAIAAGGPEHAIDVCKLRAPRLALDASSPDVRVGRTSHRLRNPKNAPPAWAAPLLAEYVAGRRGGDSAVVPLARGGAGYVEPIFAGAMCLTCHGDAVAPPLAAKLRSLYPEDRAVGFAAGELRGLFWVELSAEAVP